MHLVKAFTHLQIKKIPSKYILKRYTRDAKSFVEWDRNDMVNSRQDGMEEQLRFTKLVPVAMGLARAGSKSDYAYEETLKRATSLRALIETIPANVTTSDAMPSQSPNVAEAWDSQVPMSASPISRIKGRAPEKRKQPTEAYAPPSTST